MGQEHPPDTPPLRPTDGFKSELPIDLQRVWTQRNFERSQTYHKSRSAAEILIINWLFALNTGSLAGALSFASSRGLSDHIHYSVICSGAGILCLLFRAMCSYYRAEFKFYGALRRDIAAFDADTLTTVDFLQRDRDRSKGSHLLHLLGWAAGLLLLASFGFGYLGLRESTPPPPDRAICQLYGARGFGFAAALHRRCDFRASSSSATRFSG